MKKALCEKVAIITGAAQGRGAEEARLFIRQGACVAIADTVDKGADLAAQLGSNAAYVRLDVTDQGSWSAAVAFTLRRFGSLDVLVNNADLFTPMAFEETNVDLMERHFRVNQLGVFLGMQAVAQAMRDGGGGAIVNVASGVALRGVPGALAYSATKWAVRGMTKVAAVELASWRIRVNAVLPGSIEGPWFNARSAEEQLAAVAQIPVGRLGTAVEVAQATAYLASDAAAYVSGAEIAVDGALFA